ncbi:MULTISPECIES: hypothetical protein [Methylobacterium]|uniref:Uncharacterized protein n=3 Tax=Pseudomonadota TaxID=1224 RepID=A0ABQ4SR78_9HYPH|nr:MULTISPECIES: hypothetical protein [Methylobacterium]PIU05910.1 MAG: hypothetical protein COT56_12580 [Methylobacterium sp. CG09_land_8_20_14_0_10_71_15]PIU12722.1 MAG: hypothetical protein COT28_14015 [Methylobacterium sp. CG08_land_8_20_14_0_20_71_15]GBU18767.1 hypothetical protein AwMethylo_29820 [Methylobacterium sp.]GJE05729.1 hypothetical protein AOPFMNJM_1035 [Methylobacterium jeotgali]
MQHQDPRVASMFRRDCAAAIGAVVAVWLIYGFTFWTMRSAFEASQVTWIMVVLGACVLFLNTAAIAAMIRHYGEDRAAIYGMDIYYLDRLREERRRVKGSR